MASIYVISDTHFNQRMMIKFGKRPFKDLIEMNRKIITNWNHTVNDKDVVIIIGDLGSNNHLPYKYLFKRLNGKKILVKGNHDYFTRIQELKKLNNIKIYKQIEIEVGSKSILLTHKPKKSKHQEAFHIVIHGHYHRKLLPKRFLQDKHWNAAVEHNNFKPKCLREILLTKELITHHCFDFKDVFNQIIFHNRDNLIFA